MHELHKITGMFHIGIFFFFTGRNQIAARKKFHPGLGPTGEKGGVGVDLTSSPGSITVAGGRLRKSKRMKLYYESMSKLNFKFAGKILINILMNLDFSN